MPGSTEALDASRKTPEDIDFWATSNVPYARASRVIVSAKYAISDSVLNTLGET